MKSVALLCLACGVAHADDPPAEAPGEVIVITGSRTPQPIDDEPAATTVMTDADIARSPTRLADDLLRAMPSVGMFRRSSSAIADPTSQGLNLRGVGPSGVSRALVLADGVPLNDPFGGWVYWRAISPLALDRVEIVPSTGSALFGDYALGGVIQLVSRPLRAREAHALVAGGSASTSRLAVAASERFGDVAIGVDGEAFHSGGYTPIATPGAVDHPAESTHGSAALRAAYLRGRSDLHATLHWFDESLDAGTQLTTASVRTLRASAGGTWVGDHGTLNAELFGGIQRFTQDRARVPPDRSAATLASHQTTPSNDQGAVATWTLPASEHHRLVAGADLRRVTGTATDHLMPPMASDTSLVERSAGGEQRFAGAFVEDLVRATARWDVSAALRVDAYENRAGRRTLTANNGDRTVDDFTARSDVQLDPRLGAVFHATDAITLRGSVYRAFRAPTLNELYRPFQVGTILTDANPDLRAETLWGAEAGTQITQGAFAARATGFVDRLAAPIDNVTLDMPLPDGAMRERQNLGAARIAGVELAASWRPAPAWAVTAAETFADAVVTSAPDHADLIGKRLAQDPRHRATATVAYDDTAVGSALVQVRYLGRQYEDDLNTLPIGAVVLVDAYAARSLAYGFTVFATIENLFDRRYVVGRAGVDTLGTPRTFQIGLRFDAK